jgi:hypothetical protein
MTTFYTHLFEPLLELVHVEISRLIRSVDRSVRATLAPGLVNAASSALIHSHGGQEVTSSTEKKFKYKKKENNIFWGGISILLSS